MNGLFVVNFSVYVGLRPTLLRVAKIYSVEDYISEEDIESFSEILIDSVSKEFGYPKEMVTVEVDKK